jgi:serine/threonine-protein kinase
LFDEHGIVRVADFGLARALAEASWTEPAGTVVGTARYSAPEQAGGAALDGRADLYALAVVLVEACTGEVPLVAETAIGTLTARAAKPITPPLELGPLAPVLGRAGRPDPSARYADSAAMGAALADAARHLGNPAPLVLAGFGDDVEDVEPTRIGRTRLFDQDAKPRAAAVAPADGAPLAIVTDTRPAMRRSAVPVVVALALAAALVGALVAFRSTGGGATVSVPGLVGLSREEAAARATDAGLLMRVVERRTADDPAGLVIEQKPGPGAFLGEGDEIDVVGGRRRWRCPRSRAHPSRRPRPRWSRPGSSWRSNADTTRPSPRTSRSAPSPPRAARRRASRP